MKQSLTGRDAKVRAAPAPLPRPQPAPALLPAPAASPALARRGLVDLRPSHQPPSVPSHRMPARARRGRRGRP
eukprot:3370672-Prymnesium_polylepis.1